MRYWGDNAGWPAFGWVRYGVSGGRGVGDGAGLMDKRGRRRLYAIAIRRLRSFVSDQAVASSEAAVAPVEVPVSFSVPNPVSGCAGR